MPRKSGHVLKKGLGEMVESPAVKEAAVALIGAASGAVVSTILMDHFQDMARGHFVVRRLEGIYGEAVVRKECERL